jgi:hypothetical protein
MLVLFNIDAICFRFVVGVKGVWVNEQLFFCFFVCILVFYATDFQNLLPQKSLDRSEKTFLEPPSALAQTKNLTANVPTTIAKLCRCCHQTDQHVTGHL